MNTQERDQLNTFLLQLGQARAGVKDSEAQTLIDNALARQPDAAYLLVQRCLLQDGALQAAQAQISSLQAELQQARQGSAAGGTGFLDSNAWGRGLAVPSYVAPSPAAAPPWRACCSSACRLLIWACAACKAPSCSKQRCTSR